MVEVLTSLSFMVLSNQAVLTATSAAQHSAPALSFSFRGWPRLMGTRHRFV